MYAICIILVKGTHFFVLFSFKGVQKTDKKKGPAAGNASVRVIIWLCLALINLQRELKAPWVGSFLLQGKVGKKCQGEGTHPAVHVVQAARAQAALFHHSKSPVSWNFKFQLAILAQSLKQVLHWMETQNYSNISLQDLLVLFNVN